MLARVRLALLSDNPFERLCHFIYGTILYGLPQSLRRRIFAGDEHYCPICESHLSRYLVLHRHYHLWCPVCRSLQRHRFVWLFFTKICNLTDSPYSMLHLAPEPGLASRFSKIQTLRYISMDLYDSKAMVQMDITNIEYPESSFDIIYCSHVLEHVPDDHKAISELYRVLEPSGRAAIMVPIIAEKTVEDLTITDPKEREKLFGQRDHVRSYGPDFEDRLEKSGFRTRVVKTQDLADADEIVRLGLVFDEAIFFCTK